MKKISPQLLYCKNLNNEFGENIKTDGNSVYQWNGVFWQEWNEKDAIRHAFNWLARNQQEHASEKYATSCFSSSLLHLPQFNAIDDSSVKIPTLNSYVVVNSDGHIKSIQPNKNLGLRYVVNCEFNKDATCLTFKEFIKEAIPCNETRDFLQEYTGYTLLNDVRHQLAAWLIGDGGTGKDTFLQVITALHRNTISLSLDSLDGFKLSLLKDASLACVDETPKKIDEERIKTIISGDLIQVDRKHRDPISVRPQAKWFVCGNALPYVNDSSSGFWRRWIIFPFNVKPKQKKLLLAEKIINTELSGVLNWALEGLSRLLKRGEFPPLTDQMRSAIGDGRKHSDSIAQWLEDCGVEFDENCKNTRTDVYSHYSTWCRESNVKPEGSPRFWEKIKMKFPGLPDSRQANREMVEGKRKAVVNISLPIL